MSDLNYPVVEILHKLLPSTFPEAPSCRGNQFSKEIAKILLANSNSFGLSAETRRSLLTTKFWIVMYNLKY